MAFNFNPFQQQRQRSIFAPPIPSPTNPVQGVNPEMSQFETDDQDEASKYFDAIQRLRSNVSPAVSAYNRLLMNMPRESDYEPGKMGKFVGALTGIAAGIRNPGAGAFAADQIIKAPYEEALARHKQQLAQTGEAAQLERQDIRDQIQGLAQARALGLRYDEFKLKQLENEQRNQYQGRMATTAERRAATGEEAQKNLAGYRGSQISNEQARIKDAQRRTEILFKNANTAAAAQQSLDAYHKVMGTAATKRAQIYADRATGKIQAPYQQAKALQTALTLMRADPNFRDFIEYDQEANVFVPRESDGTAKYDLFKKALKKFVESGVTTSSPFPDEEDDDSDMFEIIRK